MMRSLLIDTVDASSLLLFRYQWLSSLLSDHRCTFVMQASQETGATPLPRVFLAVPAFHWKGKTQGRLQAIKKLIESDPAAVWISHQQTWQLSPPQTSLWTAEAFPAQAAQIELPVSPWAEPPEWEYLAEICDQEAAGHAYFFCVADALTEKQVVQVLKAFSLFKKWQQSSLQLLISWAQPPRYYASLLQQVETYKYRKDLHLKTGMDPNQLARLILGAYACLHYGVASSRDWILTAATLDVPVVAAPAADLTDFFEESVAWISVENWEQLGQQLIRLYKDEAYRNECIRSARARAKPWTHAEMAQRWQERLKN
jgi:glycosyltransferase involved in cell wall biosynthesis